MHLRTNSLFETEPDEKIEAVGHIIRVALESGADAEFDYAVDDKDWPVEPGRRVEVPFGRGNRSAVGFCIDADIPIEQSFAAGAGKKLKKVSKVIDEKPLLDADLLKLARWISRYYVCPLGQALAAMVPGAVKKNIGLKRQRCVYLAADSEKKLDAVKGKKQKKIVDILRLHSVFKAEDGIELRSLLLQADCTQAPLKKLAEKQIVKIAHRTVLRPLPSIPEGASIAGKAVTLNNEQQAALADIESRINSGQFGVTLLHGVTDSGKTEIYIRAVETALANGKSSIILLPEIALTTQTVQRFRCRFEKIAVLHSGLTATERSLQWRRIKAGDANVVIGARSAVFAPLSDLGLIVVDEEHEPSFKQDNVPRYHGRDVAIKRAQLCSGHCLLGSATPSLEMLFNCTNKKHFHRINLRKRVMGFPMPRMKLVDLRQSVIDTDGINLISKPLAERLDEVLAKKEQAILLLNRRGYSNFVFCSSCKQSLRCRNCDVTLTFHKRRSIVGPAMKMVTGKHINYGYAMCHYCGAQRLVPQKCELCGKPIIMIGLGSQRLEEEIAKKFPQARVSRVDSDSMAGRDYYQVLNDFSRQRIDILAGTQMLAKGLHFPNVTLVGIISADTSLYLPDFRANERTFQLICQVAGRAGRSEKKGVVFIQTFFPDQPAIEFALSHDYAGFVQEELKHRKACNLPPFWRLARIVLRGAKFDRLEPACKKMRQTIDRIIRKDKLDINVRGPIPAVISRVSGFHRMQIILQSPAAEILQRLFAKLRKTEPARGGVRVAIDVDAVNLL